MKLYIIRHGETFQTKNNIAYTPENWRTSPILPEGIPAIEAQAKYLKEVETDANYTSPIERCIQTVEIVSGFAGKNFLPNELLTEYAEWEESFESLRERGQKFIKYLEEQHIESTVICTHGGIISAIKYLLVYGKYELKNLTDYPAPGIMTIIDGGKFEEINFN